MDLFVDRVLAMTILEPVPATVARAPAYPVGKANPTADLLLPLALHDEWLKEVQPEHGFKNKALRAIGTYRAEVRAWAGYPISRNAARVQQKKEVMT